MVAASISTISLLNPALDKNWVCRHWLLQFIFGNWCHIQCSDLFRFLVNSKFTERFHFPCMDRLSFSYFHLLTFVSSVILALQVCALILGDAVRIFHTTDAKCVMFGVDWHRSPKGSATSALFYVNFSAAWKSLWLWWKFTQSEEKLLMHIDLCHLNFKTYYSLFKVGVILFHNAGSFCPH